MKTSHWAPTAILTVLAASGCADRGANYEWGDYEGGLYTYYKDPASAAKFADSLRDSMAEAETSGDKVPPGLHAEYGNLMLQSGNYAVAIDQFNREKALWPESAAFMDIMIKSATEQSKRTQTATGS